MSSPATLLAEFDGAEAMKHAARALERNGCRRFELYLPCPDEEAERMALPSRPKLRWATLAGGLFGAAGGYLLQWYCNAVSYPLNVGGRPLHSAPAFVFITFESTVLVSALATLAGLLVSARLWRLWRPVFEVPDFRRASDDRYWIELCCGDAGLDDDHATRIFERSGSLRVLRRETEP